MNPENTLQILRVLITKPLAYEALVQGMGIKDSDSRVQFKELLENLTADGTLIKTRKNLYAFPEDLNLRVGRVKKNPKGFGFLISDNPDQEDLFIPSADLHGAMNLDKVIVRLTRPGGQNNKTGQTYRAEGKVIRILERHRTIFLGTLERSKHFSFVIPDDPLFDGDIFIPKSKNVKARTDDKVLVEIEKWPESKRSAEGRILEVVGHKDDIGMDVLSIALRYGLEINFPEEVEAYAKTVPQRLSPQEMEGRIDLRSKLFITIDGADAKDLDDAISLERSDQDHFLLTTAIADVGHYVPENGVLDKEALKRGTSVYLVDRVIPMLPPALSNGICSLNVGEDRLVMVCQMMIDHQGKVVQSEVFEGMIKVSYRMTYDEVNAIYSGDEKVMKKYQSLLPMLYDLKDVRNILKAKRHQRGAVDFNIPESVVSVDDQGVPTDIGFRQRGISETLIEECMLVANETVAEKYYHLRVPFLYRVHEAPEVEKCNGARDFLQVLGYNLPVGGKLHPRDYQNLLEEVGEDSNAYPIQMVLLRSMNHAYYSEESKGHFGLAADYYTHFTSPIRRYSDLAIHRIIKEMLLHKNTLPSGRLKNLEKRVRSYAEKASTTERVAEQAERDSVDLKKVEYMADYVGQTFIGRIVSVTGFGFFVQLSNSAEGLVHISTLVDDFYHFHDKSLQLVGEHGGRVFKLGQEVEVQLTRANVEEGKLDLELTHPNEGLNYPPLSSPDTPAEKKKGKKTKKKKSAN